MKKILIIGNGFLGKKCATLFKQKGFHVSTADIENADYLIDITSALSIDAVFTDLKPDIVVLTAGIANVDFCEENPTECARVNIEGTTNIAHACKHFNAFLVFISSDFVFDGQQGNYTETDVLHPINEYGISKLEAENSILSLLPEHALLLRVSTLYGFNSPQDKAHFVKWVKNALTEMKSITVVEDQITSPTFIDDIAESILTLLEKNEKGVFHCTGSEALSRFAFAVKIAETFGLHMTLLKKGESNDLQQKAMRPLNSSLNIKKLNTAGVMMHAPSEGLKLMKKQMLEYTGIEPK